MSTWFISRHPGACEWIASQGLHVDHFVEHLHAHAIQPGDTVIGTLPVNLAAEICQRGASFINLTLDLPADARGREITANDMLRFGARLQAFKITPGDYT